MSKFAGEIAMLRHAYRQERGVFPVALCMHYDDWDRLRSEMAYLTVFPAGFNEKACFMGMTILLSAKQPRKFPACMGQKAAAEAVEIGARAA